MSTQTAAITATGRRKTATARVRLTPGSGSITVNGKPAEIYLYSEQLHQQALAPLRVVEKTDSVDLTIRVNGGGANGQAGAIAHAIARALEKQDAEQRIPLKRAGHITRDPRTKERKKSGQPGARKRFQFSKR